MAGIRLEVLHLKQEMYALDKDAWTPCFVFVLFLRKWFGSQSKMKNYSDNTTTDNKALWAPNPYWSQRRFKTQVHARTHTAFYKVDRIARSGRFWSRSTFEAARSAWRKWHREWRDGEKSHKNKAAFGWFVNPRPQLIVWRWLEHSPNTSVLPTDLRSDLGDMRTWTEGSAKWFQLWQARQTLCTVTPCCQWD